MITTAPSKNYFRVAPVRAAPVRVDRDKGIIYGAALMQLGEVNDSDARPMRVDDTTLAQVAQLGSAESAGLKSRFTHPNMSSDGMGRHLGRYRNFRIDGDKVRADLHMAKAALKRDYGQYTLDLADEDPGLFGNSVHIAHDEEAMDETEDEHGLKAIRIKRLKAADVVDDPAATRGGFFGSLDDKAEVPRVVTEFLDAHFAGASPDAVRARLDGFLNHYYSTKGTPAMATATAPATTATPDYESKFAALEGRITVLLEQVNAIPQKVSDATAEANARAANFTALFATAGFSDAPELQVLLKDGGKTIHDARQVVLDKMFSRQSGGGAVSGGSNDPAPKDPDAKFKAEYQTDVEYFRKSGTTEADYVMSRRITEHHNGRPHELLV